ncbi:MAG: hypothetical protein BGO51_22635 [Rhodospirillales bacterium 69-11]|nr:MAG: hypothetical protein BGO51_22635 [Rhodospirillales bacterium 69-11]
MQPIDSDTPAAWTVADLQRDPSWISSLGDAARLDLVGTVRRAYEAGKPLLDYERDAFDLGAAAAPIAAAVRQARDGRGFALLRGLPREELSAAEFELLTWAIGLHVGVARPQGKASHYLSAVRDAGTVYRSGRGRGYSSNAELDFHTDSADLVLLSCYNVAAEGGESLVTSSVAAHAALAAEDPALAALLHAPFHFSRQEEQAPDEEPFYPNPIFDEAEGVLCSKWNRNRLMSAQRIPGVPALTDAQRHALDRLDALLRDPRLMYRMYLQPGDMQLLNNHVTLHSRTEFVDHAEPERRRTLFRLWLAPPDWPRLPESWRPAYRAVERGTVRGGIRGQAYDAACRAYEARQAAALGMRLPEEPVAG